MSLEIESRGLFEDLIAQPLAVALLEAALSQGRLLSLIHI